MRWRWHKGAELRRQAAALRDRLGELANVGSNGRTRGTGIQALIHRRPRRRRRLAVGILVALLALVALGARHCATVQVITDAQRRRARVDLYIACHINKCSAEQLAGLLRQLDAMGVAEEPDR